MIKQLNKGLKTKLIRSHLSIAGLGILFLLISLIVIFMLRGNINFLVEKSLPEVQIIEEMKTGLQRSLASLRGWVAIPDNRFVIERKTTWENILFKDLTILEKMAQDNSEKKMVIKKLKKTLVSLQAWQWHVEEVAQTPGNHSAMVFLNQKISLIEKRIYAITSLLIKKQSNETKNDTILPLANFRSNLTSASSALSNYIITSDKNNLSRSNESIQQLTLLLKRISSNSIKLKKENKNIKLLGEVFQNYLNLRAQLLLIKEHEIPNLAAEWLHKKAVPLARMADNYLEILNEIIKKELAHEIKKVETINNIILFIISFFILAILFASIGLAKHFAISLLQPINKLIDATKNLAEGRLNENLPVLRNDEIGTLTNTFNLMREQRQLSDERINAIVETAVDPIISISEKGIILSCNSATTEMFQYKARELIGKKINILMPEPYKSKHDNYLSNYLKTKVKKIIGSAREVKGQTKSGEIFPIMLSVSEVVVANERTFTGIIRDLRALKKQQNQLKELNNKLEIDNNEKNIVASLDNALRSIFDIEFFAKKVLDFFAHHFKTKLSIFYQVNSKDKSIIVDGVYGIKERRKRKSFVKWGDGLVGQCIINQSLMEIKNIPKDYYKVVTGLGETPPKCIILLPLIYDEEVTGLIEMCSFESYNQEKIRLLKICSNNIASYLSLVMANKELKKLLKKTEKQQAYLTQQEEELRSANEELAEQTSSLKVSEEELSATNEELNQQVDFIKVQKDELKAKHDEIEKISSYKSQFLANMSHELRTPLNSLLIISQEFIKNRNKNLTPEQVKEAEIIYDAGNDLLLLINDILDISKVEAGKLVIQTESVDLVKILKKLDKSFTPIALKNNVKFIIDNTLNKDSSTIKCDGFRLEQILKNIISNAIKFTKNGTVTLKLTNSKQKTSFKVTDTGIGISQENLKNIFSEFKQVDAKTNKNYGGTGLGLAISQKLAQLLNGEIKVQSSLGSGSEFELVLDEVEEDNDKQRQVEQCNEIVKQAAIPQNRLHNNISNDRNTLSKGKPSLLIIDDDEVFLNHIAKIAKENNFDILQSTSGKIGFDLAKKNLPSGIILDLSLPDISGKKVLNKLKKDPQTQDIPVHIISARDKSNDLINSGAVTFLQKPVSESKVAEVLKLISHNSINKILIVEDDHITKKGLSELFREMENVQVSFAKSAKEAKLKANKQNYNCIIVDLGLPDQSGIDLIKELSDLPNFFSPIIVYTARDLTIDEHKKIKKYTNSIIIKGKHATDRLFDEIQLFLYHVDSSNPALKDLPKTEANSIYEDRLVLLVDDDIRNSFALSRALEKEGLNVIIADNGELAIEKLLETPDIDMVLMDMMMPVMDGFEAIKKIRSMDKYKNLPIISLTAKATTNDRDECINCGANDYMSKPINVDELLALLKIWLYDKGVKS